MIYLGKELIHLVLSRETITNYEYWEMDLHVHTNASHCSSRLILDAYNESRENDLKIVGFVDHLHEDNIITLFERKKIIDELDNNDELLTLLGIEIDFYKKNQDEYDLEFLSKFDIVSGAIHWLNNYPVNFFPEMKEENKVKGLKPIELRKEVLAEIKETSTEYFLDLYLGTIDSLLEHPNVEIWAHPFRSLGFLLIYDQDYLEFFYENYISKIIKKLKETNKIFELNEGLNNSLFYRGGEFYTQKLQKKWTQFYSKVLAKILDEDIMVVFGTDSHSNSTKIGRYNWALEVLNQANKIREEK